MRRKNSFGGGRVLVSLFDPIFSQSGNSAVWYGKHRKESDIQRCDGRLREQLSKYVCDRIWSAIIALGVVDVEGRKNW